MTLSAGERPGHLRRNRMARVAGLALLGLGLTHLVTATTGPDLNQLMQRMALRPHAHAAFTERHYLALLAGPLETSGELFFDAPDRLEKRTLVPKQESLVLEQDTLTIRRGRRHYQLQLQEYPQLAAVVDCVRATLAGDLAALQRAYALQFEVTAEGWQLRLVPQDQRLAAMVKEIRIAGLQDDVRSVEIKQGNGDHSTLLIHALN